MDDRKTHLIPPSDFERASTHHVSSTPRGRLNSHEHADQAGNASTFLSLSAHPTSTFLPPAGTDRYVNEAITRQAMQIAELHEEIRRLEAERLREKLMRENEVAVQKSHYDARISTLQEERLMLTERVERVERDARARFDTENAQLRTRMEELESTLNHTNSNARSQVSRLEAALAEAKAECSDVKRALREADTYVEEAHERFAAVTKWESERASVEQRVRETELRANVFEKERAVVETRLAALRDALHIHERALCDSAAPVLSINAASSASGTSPFALALGGSELTPEVAARAASDLISRWREAAYELMVRLRETEMAHRSDAHVLSQREVEAQRREQLARAQLEAAARELETDRTEIDLMRERLASAGDKIKQLEDKNAALEAALIGSRSEVETTIQTVTARVRAFQESFADGLRRFEQSTRARIGVVETEKLFRAQNRVRLLADSVRELHLRLADAERNWQTERSALERLVSEKHERETALVNELEESKKSNLLQVSQLELRIAAAERELNVMRTECDASRTQLAAVANERDQLDAAYAKAHERVSQFERTFDRLVDEKVRESLREMEARFADLQAEHRELKREHAKTIVSLRQVERALDREKEIFDKQRQQTEEDFGREVEALRAQLRTAEKDRNMLLSSMKQETLLRKLKQARPAPAELLTSDDEDFQRQVIVTSSKLVSPTRPPPAGSSAADRVRLQSLIDNVKQLSKQLEDD